VLTMSDSALRLCGTRRFYYFYDVTKPCLQNVYDDIVMVCMFVRCSLFKNCYAATEYKTNKDVSRK